MTASPEIIGKPWPWFPWLAAAGAMILVVAGIWLAIDLKNERELLRADPDALPGGSPLMPFAIERGARIYAKNCQRCHVAAGKGDATRGMPSLADDDWLYGRGTPSDIEHIVAYGIRSWHPKGWHFATMPAYGRLTASTAADQNPLKPAEIQDVIEFLARTSGESADPFAAERGSTVYVQRGGCYDCHAVDAHGNSAIGAPNLVDRIFLYGGDRAALFDSIANGRQGACPAWTNVIDAAAIREVSMYVYSLSHSAGRK